MLTVSEFEEFEEIPTQKIERQFEVAARLINKYEEVYKDINAFHNKIFTYAPETLEWATGSSMAVIQGDFEDELKYLKGWYNDMKQLLDYRREHNGKT